MSFTLVPDAVIARSGLTLIGAGNEALAVDEGVLTHDGDTSRFTMNTQGSSCELQFADPPGPVNPAVRTSLWLVLRLDGVASPGPEGDYIFPTLILSLKCHVSGRVIQLGTRLLTSGSYQVFILPFENDLSDDDWLGLHVKLEYQKPVTQPKISVTAIELRAVDPPSSGRPFVTGRVAQAPRPIARAASAGQVRGRAG